jgi:plastocyanin
MRALAILLVSTTAAAGTVKGTVRFTGTPPEATDPDRSNDKYCAGVDPPPPDIEVADGKLKDAVVEIVGDFPDAPAAPTDPVVVTQSKCEYTPRVAVAREGQTIEVENDDPTFHNVRIVQDGKVLLNKPQSQGAAPLHTDAVTDPGTAIELHCDVHSWMKSWVVVSPTAYYAITGADGKFSIPDVPAGKYNLVVWHAGLDRVMKKVTVKKGKKVTKVDTSLNLDDR